MVLLPLTDKIFAIYVIAGMVEVLVGCLTLYIDQMGSEESRPKQVVGIRHAQILY